MIALGVSRSTYFRRRKQACQRALAVDRQAIIERAEAFIHQLQEALARCSSAIDVMGALLKESRERCDIFSCI